MIMSFLTMGEVLLGSSGAAAGAATCCWCPCMQITGEFWDGGGTTHKWGDQFGTSSSTTVSKTDPLLT